MTLRVGNDHKLYYNSGTDAAPVWVEIDIVGDVTVPFTINEAQIDLRNSDYLMGLAAKIESGFDFFLAADVGGTVWTALKDLALGRSEVQMASANDDIATSGTEYFKAFARFSDFPWSQPTQEIGSGECTMGLAYVEEAGSLVLPSWTVVP